MKTKLNVFGMTCEGCAKSVQNALMSVVGVHEVVVSLTKEQALIDHDETVAIEALTLAIEDAGFSTT